MYVIWEPVLGGSHDRARDASTNITGPNVTHYWDPNAASGQWAEEHLPWDQLFGPAWDVFYLFDRDAAWTDQPEPVIATGFTIVGRRDTLADGLTQLLG